MKKRKHESLAADPHALRRTKFTARAVQKPVALVCAIMRRHLVVAVLAALAAVAVAQQYDILSGVENIALGSSLLVRLSHRFSNAALPLGHVWPSFPCSL